MSLLVARTSYSRAEYLSDAVVHVAGLSLTLAAVPVLITLTVFLRAEPAAVVGVSVYGAALLAMILCSALYNIAGHGGWSWLLQRLDHAAIYVKIAGTYTPFTLLSGQGHWLLAGLWGAALAGTGLKLAAPTRLRPLALALYLGMGWAGLAAGSPFLATLSTPVLALMLTGGALYTLGVAFYLFDRLPFHYTIWHIHVLTASALFYAAVMLHMMQGAG